jgi:hypothetical protein
MPFRFSSSNVAAKEPITYETQDQQKTDFNIEYFYEKEQLHRNPSQWLLTYTVPEHLPCQTASFLFSFSSFSMTPTPNPALGNSVLQPSRLDLPPECNLSTTCSINQPYPQNKCDCLNLYIPKKKKKTTTTLQKATHMHLKCLYIDGNQKGGKKKKTDGQFRSTPPSPTTNT